VHLDADSYGTFVKHIIAQGNGSRRGDAGGSLLMLAQLAVVRQAASNCSIRMVTNVLALKASIIK
jgi:hypothetical protein